MPHTVLHLVLKLFYCCSLVGETGSADSTSGKYSAAKGCFSRDRWMLLSWEQAGDECDSTAQVVFQERVT